MKEVFYPEDRPMKYFNFEDFDEFIEITDGSSMVDIVYYSPVFKDDCAFLITDDSNGWNIWPRDKKYRESHHKAFDTRKQMIQEYIFPDGLAMKDLWENAIAPKWEYIYKD